MIVSYVIFDRFCETIMQMDMTFCVGLVYNRLTASDITEAVLITCVVPYRKNKLLLLCPTTQFTPTEQLRVDAYTGYCYDGLGGLVLSLRSRSLSS